MYWMDVLKRKHAVKFPRPVRKEFVFASKDSSGIQKELVVQVILYLMILVLLMLSQRLMTLAITMGHQW